MKIFLAALDEPLASAWQRHCGSLPNVTVHCGSILDLSVDAVVSPANSFGFMDGGVDHLYSQHFGWGLQKQLQEQIRAHHHGELLVGAAEIVETQNLAIPFLIAAPTMRCSDGARQFGQPVSGGQSRAPARKARVFSFRRAGRGTDFNGRDLNCIPRDGHWHWQNRSECLRPSGAHRDRGSPFART
jgi:hypothetical protein